MARSQYIYFIKRILTDQVVAAFTVKYEAIAWAKKNNEIAISYLTRINDGVTDKTETELSWTEKK
ncbi:MAG: hypothetical protein ACFFG0_09250 [Candidatus Thorarchaeota archaeon]